MKISAIITAAGSSSRFGKQKLLEDLNGKSVIERTIETFNSIDSINEIIICTSEEIIDEIKKLSINYKKVKFIILGGKTRQESVYKGLLEAIDSDFVAIHDGARPLISAEIIDMTITKAIEYGNAACAVSVKDTIKKVIDDQIVETPNREDLWQIQTPQIFTTSKILKAHKKYINQNAPDDTFLLEKMGEKVFIIKGCYSNIKITTPEDAQLARILDKG